MIQDKPIIRIIHRLGDNRWIDIKITDEGCTFEHLEEWDLPEEYLQEKEFKALKNFGII